MNLLQKLNNWLAPIINPMALMPEHLPESPSEHCRLKPSIAGDTGGLRLGQGKSFYGLKPYNAGDDTRMLDWAVYARTRHPHIRQYQQDERAVVWCVVLDGPDWHCGHHQPLYAQAQTLLENLFTQSPFNPVKDTRLGLWWLGQEQWFTQKPALPTDALKTISHCWHSPLPGFAYTSTYTKDNGIGVIPQRQFNRDNWLILAPAGDKRILSGMPIPPTRLQTFVFADPWWQRWTPTMQGVRLAETGNRLDHPGSGQVWPGYDPSVKLIVSH